MMTFFVSSLGSLTHSRWGGREEEGRVRVEGRRGKGSKGEGGEEESEGRGE